MKKLFLTVLGLAAISTSVYADDSIVPEVIYGVDNPQDIFYAGNAGLHVDLARSTAALMKSSSLAEDPTNPDLTDIKSDIFGERYNLCESERFREQINPGFCSGFLVGENILVTAGHCVRSESDCESTSFVFGFGFTAEGQDLSSVPTEDIYTCKNLIKQELSSGSKSDYAVIELDRPVLDRIPLEFRTEGVVENDAPLVVIGHPAGLPAKISAGANVRSNVPKAYFTANLDTYGGNSGSAVFDADTGVVEGILVRGETDFKYEGSCRVSYVCENDECRGEDVTKSTEFAEYVPAASKY